MTLTRNILIKILKQHPEELSINHPLGHINNPLIKTPLPSKFPGPSLSGKPLTKIQSGLSDITTGPSRKIIARKPTQFVYSQHSHPSKDLYVIGITGTNGKTSVSYLIGEVLKSAGYNAFVLGAINSGNKDLSTPEEHDISKIMKSHLDQGGTHFIMEVTSEGIEQARILGIEFNLKLLTNITQDHLDFQKTFEKHQNTKLNFMREGPAHKIHPDYFEQEPIGFSTKLLGHFNLLNIKAAACVLRHMNVDEENIQKTLSSCSPPRGRLEFIDKGQAFLVLVDDAHTPNGLLNVLQTLKTIANKRKGRLLVLFGCGGDRDNSKRPEMGKIAGDIADYLVITEDNPRQEASQVIIADIVNGINPDYKDYVVIQDRKRAIKHIISQSQNNDVVILAGKGHETYQILKSETIHFDDREEASYALTNRLKN